MIDRLALAAAFEATADKLADVAYNQMQKSEEANAMFDRAQEYRRAADALYADGRLEGVEYSLGCDISGSGGLNSCVVP